MKDNSTWLREMCEDYRLETDDSDQSHRLAINGMIHRLRAEVERLRAKLENWESRVRCAIGLLNAALEEKEKADEK